MKELSQYKEEIFKRSEHRIRQRKIRRRIALGVSIPLCLCLVISGGMFAKQLTNFKSDAAAEMAPESGYLMDSDDNCSPNLDKVADEVTFTARVLECGDNWVLVEPMAYEAERNCSDKISFGTAKLEPLNIRPGSLVTITYDGLIMESYPAQITPSHWDYAIQEEG